MYISSMFFQSCEVEVEAESDARSIVQSCLQILQIPVSKMTCLSKHYENNCKNCNVKIENFQSKNFVIFLICTQNIDLGTC